MSNLLTVSRMRTWRTCKRLHQLTYLDGWRTVRAADPLRQGDIGHIGLEAWWRAEPGARLDAAIEAMAGRGDDVYEQAAMEELLRGYDNEWADQMHRYEVLVVEGSFVVPLVNPATGAPSRTWALAGKKDVVVRDLEAGTELLVEHKLTSDSFAEDSDPYWLKLGMDAQISQYYLGAETDGYSPSGCLYDVLRRPQLRPFKATPIEERQYTVAKFKQCPLCKKKSAPPAPHDIDGLACEADPEGGPRRICTDKGGKLYANQRAQDETSDEYRARIRADIAANPTKYFARRTIARTERDLFEYLTDVWAESRIMRDAELAGVAPKSPEACHRFGTCAFWNVCAYGLDPADHPELYVRVANVHPELNLQEITT